MAKKSVIIRVHPEFREVLRQLQNDLFENGRRKSDSDITLDLAIKLRRKKII